jgi:hypothetical protein
MTSNLGFIDPTAGGQRARIPLAPRPMDLAGKVVGLLDNTKEQADIILETVGETLRERYGVARVIIRRKEFFSKPCERRAVERDGERKSRWPPPPSAGEGRARCAVCTTRLNSRNAAYLRPYF